MSIFKVSLTAGNPNGGRVTMPIEVVVNTGSDLTWLPGERLRAIGIEPHRKVTLPTSKFRAVERETGLVILRANGYETCEEVVFAEPGDGILIGTHTLEGFGIEMDDLTHRFVAMETLAAFSGHALPAPTFSKAA